jgi:putative oxidoreductase
MSAQVSSKEHVTNRSTIAGLVQRSLQTSDDVRGLIARGVLGAVIFPHGAQHALGWFGGYGFEGTRAWMVSTLGVPSFVAGGSILLELVAPLLLLTASCGRLAAAWIAIFLAVAANTHSANGFFMNWLGNQKGEGFEYHLLAIALAAVVAIGGSGKLSVDRWLSKKLSTGSR